jgi:hypothetical protein
MIEVSRKEFEGEKDQYNSRIEEIEKLINTVKTA